MSVETYRVVLILRLNGGQYDSPEDGFETYDPTPEHVAAYVDEAVGSWGGQYHPGDPMFPSNIAVGVESVQLVPNTTTVPGDNDGGQE